MPISIKTKLRVQPKKRTIKKKKTVNQNPPLPYNILRSIGSKLNTRTLATVAQTCKKGKTLTKTELKERKQQKKKELKIRRRSQFENKLRNEISKIELSQAIQGNVSMYMNNMNTMFNYNSNLLTNLDKKIIKHIVLQYIQSSIYNRSYNEFPTTGPNSVNPYNGNNIDRFVKRRRKKRNEPFRFKSIRNLSF